MKGPARSTRLSQSRRCFARARRSNCCSTAEQSPALICSMAVQSLRRNDRVFEVKDLGIAIARAE